MSVQEMREIGDATLRARLLVFGGEKAQLSGDERAASQLFARSIHLCPWLPEVCKQKQYNDGPAQTFTKHVMTRYLHKSDEE